MSSVWKKKAAAYWVYFGKGLVEHAHINEGANVLDIGFGRGTSLIPASLKVGKDGFVVGIDNWVPHVKGMSEVIKKRKFHNTAIINMDAGSMGFKENSFDFLLSGFAYVFFSLKDAYPLLKTGGKVVLSSWALEEDSEWMGELIYSTFPKEIYTDYEDVDVSEETGHPRVYHKESEDKFGKLIKDAGFQEVKIISEVQRFAYKDEEEWWEIISNSGWQSCLKRIEDIGVGTRTKFKQDTFKMLQKYKESNGIGFKREVLFGIGMK